MARLALPIDIFIVTSWATFDNDAFLFCLNKLIRWFTFCATSIAYTIAILAWIIAPNTFLHTRSFIKLAERTLCAELQVNLAHFNNVLDGNRCCGPENTWRVDTVLDLYGRVPIFIKPPVGDHGWWRGRETDFLKVCDLEDWADDIPPPEFFDIAIKSILRGFHFNAATECDFSEFEDVCGD